MSTAMRIDEHEIQIASKVPISVDGGTAGEEVKRSFTRSGGQEGTRRCCGDRESDAYIWFANPNQMDGTIGATCR